VRRTLKPLFSPSGLDANMMLSSKDLFGQQCQTWASCPDWVQSMILKKIRQTIKAKINKEHGVQEDRCEGFADDWAAVVAEVESQMSSRAPARTTLRIQNQPASNPDIGALAGSLGNGIYSRHESCTSIGARWQHDSLAFPIPIHRARTVQRGWLEG